MRVLFDALGSTHSSGGMRLHSTELALAWHQRYPSDVLYFASGKWSQDDLGGRGIRVIPLDNESAWKRSAGQLLAIPYLAAANSVDAVISLSPILSPLVPRNLAYCFMHDWRHKKNPDQFSRAQIIYRLLWQLSARHARLVFCISSKTDDETRRYVPRARTAVIENGEDHPGRWTAAADPQHRGQTIVTFGHQTNKRPELVIAAFAASRWRLPTSASLVVLGATGQYAQHLAAVAEAEGVRDAVKLPGFVDAADYQSIITGASAIILASSDEGFGLPIAEARYFGIPAVVTNDSGIGALFHDFAISVEPTTEGVARGIVLAFEQRADTLPARDPRKWADAASELRSAVLGTQGMT